MPIPNAMVATTITPSSRRKRCCAAARTLGSSPAWYAAAVEPGVAQRLRELARCACGTGSRRSRPRPVALSVLTVGEEAQQLRPAARSSPRPRSRMLGRSKLETNSVASASPSRWWISRRGQRVGGGGERDPWDAGEPRRDLRDPQVLRPEVVAPLRHAVRLVDREQRDARAGGDLLEQPCEARAAGAARVRRTAGRAPRRAGHGGPARPAPESRWSSSTRRAPPAAAGPPPGRASGR